MTEKNVVNVVYVVKVVNVVSVVNVRSRVRSDSKKKELNDYWTEGGDGEETGAREQT